MFLIKTQRFRASLFKLLSVSLLLACFAFLTTSITPAHAVTTVPTTMNFQGRLADSSGNIMPDGLYNMQFRLFTVGSGGSSVWNETRENNGTDYRVQVTNGLFNTKLGEVSPLSASLFASGSLYFEITMATPATATCSTASCASWESPMTPRHELSTSAYAYNAETLDGLDSAAFGQLSQANTWTNTNTIRSDSTGAFAVQDAAGTTDMLKVDTNNSKVLVGGAIDTATAVALNIGNTNATSINLGVGTGAQTINLATGGTGAKTVTLGSTASSSALNLRAGTGNITLQGVAATTIAIGSTTQNGIIRLGQSTASNTVAIGSEIGGGAAQTINIGTSTTASSQTLLTMGSSIGTSVTAIQAGSGGINLNATDTYVSGALTVGASTTTLGGDLSVAGVSKLANTKVTKKLAYTFANGIANQKVDLYLPASTGFFGSFDVSIIGTYGTANASGELTKKFNFGGNNAGTIYTNTSNYTAVSADTAASFAISDITWDASNSRWRIQIVHRVSTGNPITIIISGSGQDSASATALGSIAIGTDYTSDVTVFSTPTTGFIQNQSSVQQTASSFWISGTGRADTSITTPLLDTATATTLSLATSSATAVTLGKSGITTTNAGALTVSQLFTGSLGATISGAATSINASSNFATNINTGSSTAAVNIGNASAGAIAIQSASGITLTGNTIVESPASGGTGRALIVNGKGTDFSIVAHDDGTTNFSISDGGKTLFKPTTDATDGFLIQNASAGDLFKIDSSNNRLYVGSSTGDSTGVLLVLDSKNTSGDPTGVEGAMYYNSSMKSFRCYRDGTWLDCGVRNIEREWLVEDEFFSGDDRIGAGTDEYNISDLMWKGTKLGTGTWGLAYNTGVVTGSVDRPGSIELYSDDSNTGGALTLDAGSDGSMHGTGMAGMVFKASVNLTDAANHVAYVGMADNLGDTAYATRPWSGAWWESNPASDGDTDSWWYCSGNNSSETFANQCVDSGVAVAADSWVRLEVRVTSTTAATYCINGNCSFSITGETIASVGHNTPGVRFYSTNSTDKSIVIDYVQVRGTTTAAR